MSSRSAGRHGAMVKPQLPMTAVVTPSAGDGETTRVPGDLRVVVRVVVDDARHQREAVGVERLASRAHVRAHGGDAPAGARPGRRAGARPPRPSTSSALRMTRSCIGRILAGPAGLRVPFALPAPGGPHALRDHERRREAPLRRDRQRRHRHLRARVRRRPPQLGAADALLRAAAIAASRTTPAAIRRPTFPTTWRSTRRRGRATTSSRSSTT